jgi:hypothetical protein
LGWGGVRTEGAAMLLEDREEETVEEGRVTGAPAIAIVERLLRKGERGGGMGMGGSAWTVWSYRKAIRLVSSRKGTSAVGRLL